MCGIVGFVRLDRGGNKSNHSFLDIQAGFSEASKRGIGAAGFYSPETGVVKDGSHPDNFIKKYRKDVLSALGSNMLIGHARAASKDPRSESPYSINGNNHPHESKNYVLIHNGYFEYIPKVKGYKYKGTCDSELAVAYIETFGPEKAIQMMSGSDSFAIVFVHKPTGTVYFYRNNNPIVYSYDVETGCLVFGSTQDTVLAMSTGFEHFGISTYSTLHCVSMEENHLYRIDKDGAFSKGEKIKRPFLAENVMGKLTSRSWRWQVFSSSVEASTAPNGMERGRGTIPQLRAWWYILRGRLLNRRPLGSLHQILYLQRLRMVFSAFTSHLNISTILHFMLDF
jgi:asparagine synthetase B (glutamine-hydrolysing)